jgi:hypothetical protein
MQCGFRFFCASIPKKRYRFLKFFFKRSKNREEVELQQGTPEVLKKCENLYPQPMKLSGCKNSSIREEKAKCTSV